ncbi:MAG: glutamate ligase domain-containing protein, partial [Bryobacteraceae bacterium]
LDNLKMHAEGSEFTAVREKRIEVRCPLAGAHQVENAVTAIAALEQLSVTPEAITEGIAETRWPGRLEVVSRHPDIILDGAHNPAGARALAAHIREFYTDRRVWLVYGAMRDKSVEEITEILFPLAQEVILTAPSAPRAIRPEALLEAADHSSMRAVPDLGAALRLAREAAPEDVVFITGSLYVVGEARALLVE